MKRRELTDFLDGVFSDLDPAADAAINGLQFPGSEDVSKVAVAVDACRETIRAAGEAGASLLFVHHGLFWTYQKPAAIDEAGKALWQLLLNHDLSIYAMHLPLDRHPVWGNNATILRALKGDSPAASQGGELDMLPFSEWKGVPTGYYTDSCRDLPVQKAMQHLSDVLDTSLARIYPAALSGYGQKIWTDPSSLELELGRVGVVTGAGSDAIAACPALGIDTLITGEVPHYSIAQAAEQGVNLLLLGHYQSELGGVQNIGRLLGEQFELTVEFLDHPTGL
jgi:dinuclear metal center YbgI/SA1388 family protein